MNSSHQLDRFDQRGSTAAVREYDAQLGAFAANAAAIVDAVAVPVRQLSVLLGRPRIAAARAAH
ncbi:MAG: hypothetical protein ABSC16_10280 [Candidatus Dormibacteria bacterium]|jgi:hypothetical protein|nr:hypothetical protein [Chloroflexota bacterium]